MVQRGSRYFQICSEVDRNKDEPAERKLECWQRWLTHYRLGQAKRYIYYAEQRRDELATGFTEPFVLGDTKKERPIPLDAVNSAAEDGLEHPCEQICDADREKCHNRCNDRRACKEACDGEKLRCIAGCM